MDRRRFWQFLAFVVDKQNGFRSAGDVKSDELRRLATVIIHRGVGDGIDERGVVAALAMLEEVVALQLGAKDAFDVKNGLAKLVGMTVAFSGRQRVKGGHPAGMLVKRLFNRGAREITLFKPRKGIPGQKSLRGGVSVYPFFLAQIVDENAVFDRSVVARARRRFRVARLHFLRL